MSSRCHPRTGEVCGYSAIFHELELRTDTGVSAYKFKHGSNVVSGDYSTGKSSMFELIKFAMGSRSAELMLDICEI